MGLWSWRFAGTIAVMFDLPPKAKAILKKLPFIILVLLVVGVIAWFVAVRPTLAYFEKKRFEAAYADLVKLSEEIQAKIGPASEVSIDNSCGRAHQKTSYGPLMCDVGINHTFSNTSPEEATKNMNTLAELFEGELRKGNLFQGNESGLPHKNIFEIRENGRTGQIFNQSINKYGGLQCTATYKHEVNNNQPFFYVFYSCGSSSLVQHYPMRN